MGDFDYQYCLEKINEYWNLYINEICFEARDLLKQILITYTEQLYAFAKDGNLHYYDD